MTHTFDIRFARSAGFAAFLEAPENRFHWKGGGLLRIDAQSISFTVKRSLLALFTGNRTQRIPAENLREVYREGEALRVEFDTKDSARVVLPFWVGDRTIAARIVQLLPTRQTVELEHSTGVTESGKPRADWRAMLVVAVALVACAAGGWLIYSRTPATPPVGAAPVDRSTALATPLPAPRTAAVNDAPPRVETPVPSPETTSSKPDPLPSFLESPTIDIAPPPPMPLPTDYVRSEDFVIPITRGTPSYDVARRELTAFERDATSIESAYRDNRRLLTSGAMSPDAFTAKLEDLEMRWWDVTFRIFDNAALADPALLDLRASMLATARLWRSFLSAYANGLRKRDHVVIANSFDDLARAQEMQSRARLFLR